VTGTREHGYDIKADLDPADQVGRQPQLRQATQTGELDRSHRLCRQPEVDARAGLDLDDDHRVTVGGDEVDLALPAAPVAVEYDEPAALEVPGGNRLAACAQFGAAARAGW